MEVILSRIMQKVGLAVFGVMLIAIVCCLAFIIYTSYGSFPFVGDRILNKNFIVENSTQDCGNFTSSDGSNYNLTPLSRSNDYQTLDTTTSYTYYWNFCRNLVSPARLCGNLAAAQVSVTGTCMINGYLTGYQLKDHPKGPTAGFTLTYVNSKIYKCKNDTLNRVTNIVVDCDSSVESSFVNITESTLCVYDIHMKSKYACPLSNINDTLA
eukprot:TRINITY_DN2770_c0_g5_i1.p1 TRINITY_DN2770_c0_g5~~TRINITY_DN2770_c0_g5_i1.p1  ORF type:complete len:211 (-),score=7.15 TRINITY_DN2770_c0_g5_i1:24-656(-)